MYISTIDKQTNFKRAWDFIDCHEDLKNRDDFNVWTLSKAFDFIDRLNRHLKRGVITESEFNFVVARYLIEKFKDEAFTIYTNVI